MSLLKSRNVRRNLHPYEAVYVLGLVRTKPGDSPEQVKRAEESAMESLSRNARAWGIVKLKRSEKPGAGCFYTEASVLTYLEECERRAGAAVSEIRLAG